MKVASTVRRGGKGTPYHAESPALLYSLNNWEDLQTYAPSAFDEETVQDLKFHRKADEIYLILRGSIRILWKVKGSKELKNYLELSAESKCWGYIVG